MIEQKSPSSPAEVVASIEQKLEESDGNEARRLFHGRGKVVAELAFLTVDWFAPVLRVTYFDEPPSGWSEAFIPGLKDLMANRGGRAITLQRRFIHKSPVELVWGELPDQAIATSRGLRYHLQHQRNQNIGFFLDMVPGHDWLRTHCVDATVLNLFAYTCAFSVVAKAGGATRVVNIDMAKGALNTGRDNHRLNGQSMQGVEFLPYDIFRSLGKLKKKGPFDVVVCDPPSYQKGSFVATKDYPRLARRFVDLVAPGGYVLLCLNAPDLDTGFIRDFMAESAPQFQWLERLENSADFPDIDPERQLKLMVYQRLSEGQ